MRGPKWGFRTKGKRDGLPDPLSQSVQTLLFVPTFIPDGGDHTLSTGLRDRS